MKTKKIHINTERFFLRTLDEKDASENYCAWFNNVDTKQYIEAAKNKNGIKELQDYIRQYHARDDVAFLGIFTKEGFHIGNIKYEPINISQAYAVMGILIGEPTWRGKGVAAEAILGSAHYLNHHIGIKKIYLGVSKLNTPAVSAYRKMGFIEQTTPELIKTSTDGMEMILFL